MASGFIRVWIIRKAHLTSTASTVSMVRSLHWCRSTKQKYAVIGSRGNTVLLSTTVSLPMEMQSWGNQLIHYQLISDKALLALSTRITKLSHVDIWRRMENVHLEMAALTITATMKREIWSILFLTFPKVYPSHRCQKSLEILTRKAGITSTIILTFAIHILGKTASWTWTMHPIRCRWIIRGMTTCQWTSTRRLLNLTSCSSIALNKCTHSSVDTIQAGISAAKPANRFLLICNLLLKFKVCRIVCLGNSNNNQFSSKWCMATRPPHIWTNSNSKNKIQTKYSKIHLSATVRCTTVTKTPNTKSLRTLETCSNVIPPIQTLKNKKVKNY